MWLLCWISIFSHNASSRRNPKVLHRYLQRELSMFGQRKGDDPKLNTPSSTRKTEKKRKLTSPSLYSTTLIDDTDQHKTPTNLHSRRMLIHPLTLFSPNSALTEEFDLDGPVQIFTVSFPLPASQFWLQVGQVCSSRSFPAHTAHPPSPSSRSDSLSIFPVDT